MDKPKLGRPQFSVLVAETDEEYILAIVLQVDTAQDLIDNPTTHGLEPGEIETGLAVQLDASRSLEMFGEQALRQLGSGARRLKVTIGCVDSIENVEDDMKAIAKTHGRRVVTTQDSNGVTTVTMEDQKPS